MQRRDLATSGLALVALVASVLLIGGGPHWALASLLLLLGLAVATTITSQRTIKLSPLTGFIGLGLALTLLQLIPLPPTLGAQLNPYGDALRTDGLALIGVNRRWQPLSLDPSSTLRQLFTQFAFLLAALLALRLTARDRHKLPVVAAVAGLGALVAITVGLHEAVNAETWLGFYRPKHGQPLLMGPLLNANHLGSFMGLATIAGIVMVVAEQRPAWRGLWILATLACLMTMLATRSRGALLAFGVGTFVAGAVLVAQQWRHRKHTPSGSSPWTLQLPVAILACCAVVMVILVAGENVTNQLAQTTLDEIDQATSKYAAWASAWRLLGESPWVGIGRGAFESVFTHIHPASSYQTFSHVENEYLQALLEWGAPGTLGLVGMGTWLGWRALSRWHQGPHAAAALGALAAIMAQSFVDFGVELPGVALPLIALIATVSHRSPALRRRPTSEGAARPSASGAMTLIASQKRLQLILARGILAGLAIGAAGLLWAQCAATIDEDRRRLGPTPSEPALRALIVRHPLEFGTYGQMAALLLRQRNAQGTEFLQHALRLHPTHPGMHRMTARLLLQAGIPTQAALEFKLAVQGSRDPRGVIQELTETFPDPAVALTALPPEWRNPEEVISLLKHGEHHQLTALWLEQYVARHPRDIHTAELWLEQGLAHDIAHAERAAQHLRRLQPTTKRIVRLAKLYATQSRYREAAETLSQIETAEGSDDEKRQGWQLKCHALRATHETLLAIRCYEDLMVSGLLRPDQVQAISVELARATEAHARGTESP